MVRRTRKKHGPWSKEKSWSILAMNRGWGDVDITREKGEGEGRGERDRQMMRMWRQRQQDLNCSSLTCP